jgi:hypothetical protein
MNQGFVSESMAGKITDSALRESPGSATLPFVKLLNRQGYVKTQSIVLYGQMLNRRFVGNVTFSVVEMKIVL